MKTTARTPYCIATEYLDSEEGRTVCTLAGLDENATRECLEELVEFCGGIVPGRTLGETARAVLVTQLRRFDRRTGDAA